MSYHRGFRSLLAMAVLTTGLVGCTDLNGLFKLPGGTTTTDGGLKPDNGGLNPGGINNPGDQLLSNGAATAITDVVATLRDVGALKHMASQQPLLSNSGSSLLSNAAGSLLSNGMSGYRVASTALPQSDVDRIVWSDDGNWPHAYAVTQETTVTGEILGKLDGQVVERYTYTATLTPKSGAPLPSYRREEQVVTSSLREKGHYVVTGEATDQAVDDMYSLMIVSGTSTFEPNGVNRKLTYDYAPIGVWVTPEVGDRYFYATDIESYVKGDLPNGNHVDMTMNFVKTLDMTTFEEIAHTLDSSGTLTIAGRKLGFKSSAAIDKQSISGALRLGLDKDFWLRFDFASNTPLVASARNDKDELVSSLSFTDDKKKVIVKHPGEDKPEHLDLSVLPRLYILGIESALPPF